MTRLQVSGLLILAATGLRLAYDAAGRSFRPTELRRPLEEFPFELPDSGWKGEDEPLEQEIVDAAGVDAHIHRTYRKGENNRNQEGDDRNQEDALLFFVGYCSGREVENPFHDPSVCLPGAGWDPMHLEPITRRLPDGRPVLFRRTIFSKAGKRQLWLYTYYYKGRFDTNELRLRNYIIFGTIGLGKGRHFTKITVSSLIRRSIDETLDRETEFIDRALPLLMEHLPE